MSWGSLWLRISISSPGMPVDEIPTDGEQYQDLIGTFFIAGKQL